MAAAPEGSRVGRKAYESNLSDEGWELLAPLLPPPPEPGGRRRSANLRDVLDAIRDRERTGCARAYLPHDFPPKSMVCHYFRKHAKNGVWQAVHDVLAARVRVQEGFDEQPSAAILDSQSAKTTDVGGEERVDDAGKKIKDRKRHILVDKLGLIMVLTVTAANVQDRGGAKDVLTAGKE